MIYRVMISLQQTTYNHVEEQEISTGIKKEIIHHIKVFSHAFAIAQKRDQHWRPLRQFRTPASEVRVATSEDDLAAKLEALA
ncbi:hypothetical protein Leryth_014292 [Lithospermum erythrorhizon]|nr:hypothetical protein Leryth_014292 [Lithospermum erythrorhizon]